MNRRIWSARRLAGFGVLALIAGVAGAQAATGGPPSPRPAAPRAESPALPAGPGPSPAVAVYPGRPSVRLSVQASGDLICRPRGRRARVAPPAATPPSDAVRNAFGILRRDRTDDDALPDRALAALEARGLRAVDPNAARLLRADRRARAWVVPVPDVASAYGSLLCGGSTAGGAAGAVQREGLAVVSVGGAPAGGGGSLRDLTKGLASASVDPCAGPGNDMIGVSGIVPDGVEAVFVTTADGGATRADVRDNGYAFVLPRTRRPEERYLVWTGADGRPHVQPLPSFGLSGRAMGCGRLADVIRVTPDPRGLTCAPSVAPPVFSVPRLARALGARRGRVRVVPRPRVLAARPAPPAAAAPLPAALDLVPRACAAMVSPAVLPGRAALKMPRPVPRPPRAAPAPTAPAAPRPAPSTSRGP